MKAPVSALLAALALSLTGCPNNNAKPAADKNEVSHDRSADRMAPRGGSDVDTSRDPALDNSLMAGSDTRTTYGSGNSSTYVPPGGSTGNSQNYTPTYSTPTDPPEKNTNVRRSNSGDESLSAGRSKGTHSGGGRTYTVKKGDTLGGISQKFYGTTTKWKQIQNANKAKVPNEKALKPGTVLVIP